jgi:hypothetical protein
MESLSELSRFVEWEGDLEWLSLPAEPSALSRFNVPNSWLLALATSGSADMQVRALWDGLRLQLPRTCEALATKVSGLALLRTRENGLSLIYQFGIGDEMVARRGFGPLSVLPPVAGRFPINLMPLYGLHDGFVHFMSYDGGPLRSRQWRTLTDPDSGEPSLVKIATDGSEAFGFDSTNFPMACYSIKPDEDEVELVDDPWAFLDDLIASRIEDI